MSPRVTPDDWKLDSGLPDDFDGEISAAVFKPNATYAAKSNVDPNTPLLHLTFRGPDIEPFEQAYSIGSGAAWEAKNGGKEVVSANNPSKHTFNASSNAGKLIERIVQLLGGGVDAKSIEKGRLTVAGLGMFMTNADFYTKFKGHFVRQEISRQASADGSFTGGTTTVLLPTAISIKGATGKPTKAKAESAAPAAPAPVAVPDEDDEDTEVASMSPELEQFSEQIPWLKRTAGGLTRRQLKAAASNEFSDDLSDTEEAFMQMLMSGDLIEKLIANKVLVLNEDGRTFASV